jgi:hypothetical protein
MISTTCTSLFDFLNCNPKFMLELHSSRVRNISIAERHYSSDYDSEQSPVHYPKTAC